MRRFLLPAFGLFAAFMLVKASWGARIEHTADSSAAGSATTASNLAATASANATTASNLAAIASANATTASNLASAALASTVTNGNLASGSIVIPAVATLLVTNGQIKAIILP